MLRRTKLCLPLLSILQRNWRVENLFNSSFVFSFQNHLFFHYFHLGKLLIIRWTFLKLIKKRLWKRLCLCLSKTVKIRVTLPIRIDLGRRNRQLNVDEREHIKICLTDISPSQIDHTLLEKLWQFPMGKSHLNF